TFIIGQPAVKLQSERSNRISPLDGRESNEESDHHLWHPLPSTACAASRAGRGLPLSNHWPKLKHLSVSCHLDHEHVAGLPVPQEIGEVAIVADGLPVYLRHQVAHPDADLVGGGPGLH